MPSAAIVKRINVNLDAHLHSRFKAAAAAQGKNMTQVLMEFIEGYVHIPVQPKRLREKQ